LVRHVDSYSVILMVFPLMDEEQFVIKGPLR